MTGRHHSTHAVTVYLAPSTARRAGESVIEWTQRIARTRPAIIDPSDARAIALAYGVRRRATLDRDLQARRDLLVRAIECGCGTITERFEWSQEIDRIDETLAIRGEVRTNA